MRIKASIQSFKGSKLFKDSFWAVFGNGLGNFLLLFSGILIARSLGKDLYGGYGLVKTTMFYIATFATFYLGNSSTKYIAEYLQRNKLNVPTIVIDSLLITFVFSSILCLLLLLFAPTIATFIKAPSLVRPLRVLGVIIVFRALSTVGAGILSGFKEFKRLGINNVLSGSLMLLLAVPLTSFFRLKGALISLLLSQICLCCLNVGFSLRKTDLSMYVKGSHFAGELISFSYPFAISELIYTFSSLGTNMLVTRFASIGELGMYTACTQWNSIILFVPGLLNGVILSYLSTTAVGERVKHTRLIVRMLMVNFVCTIVPLLVVLLCSKWIASYYGPSFAGMEKVLSIMIFATLFTCMSRVFQSELTSVGKKWTMLIIRGAYNILQLVLVYCVLSSGPKEVAISMALIILGINAFSFVLFFSEYLISNRRYRVL